MSSVVKLVSWGCCFWTLFIGVPTAIANESIVESDELILQLRKNPSVMTRGFVISRNEQTGSSQGGASSATIYVYFISGTVKIADKQSKRQLDELGQALTSKELEKDQFEICGHTDSTGSEEYNLRLSRKRAHAVNDYLEHTYGYSCALIKGYGEKQPVASNDTPEGRAKNRRVVINRLD